EERSLPQGTLDTVRLAVLADALEEAGCTDAEVLGHCRGFERCPKCQGQGEKAVKVISTPRHGRQPVSDVVMPCFDCRGRGYRPLAAGHVRGCWVVDLILGKG